MIRPCEAMSHLISDDETVGHAIVHVISDDESWGTWAPADDAAPGKVQEDEPHTSSWATHNDKSWNQTEEDKSWAWEDKSWAWEDKSWAWEDKPQAWSRDQKKDNDSDETWNYWEGQKLSGWNNSWKWSGHNHKRFKLPPRPPPPAPVWKAPAQDSCQTPCKCGLRCQRKKASHRHHSCPWFQKAFYGEWKKRRATADPNNK